MEGKLDDVGLAGETQAQGTKGERPNDAHAAARFVRGFVHYFVEHAAVGCEAVFGPLLFYVDQRPLPLAVDEMLEAGDGEEVGIGVHLQFGAGLWSKPFDDFRLQPVEWR